MAETFSEIPKSTVTNKRYVVSLYGHLGKDVTQDNYRDLSIGQKVKQNDIIGYIGFRDENGDDSREMSPHLHFEVRTPEAINDTDCGADNCLNDGYDSDPVGWIDPSDFINAHLTQ